MAVDDDANTESEYGDYHDDLADVYTYEDDDFYDARDTVDGESYVDTPTELIPPKTPTRMVDLSMFDRNLLFIVASFLPADDLARLGRICSSLGSIEDGQERSLTNDAAHRIFAFATADERNALPQYDDESDIALIRQLYLIREPLEFTQLIGNRIRYTSAESKSSVSSKYIYLGSAISNLVMRRGKHYREFNISDEGDDYYIHVGIMRPLRGWDQTNIDTFNPIFVRSYDSLSQDLIAERTERWGTSDVNCCSYCCFNGSCYRSSWSDYSGERWEGMESLREDGTIGLLLDINEGTLTMFKNGSRLGLMKDGLSGEYCWFTCMSSRKCTMKTVSIGRGTLPYG